MSKPTGKGGRWLYHYSRALRYVWPHRRYVALAVAAVVGVSVFYAASVSSVVPVLKVMFARNESVADWVYREVAQRRLKCQFVADAPSGQGIGILQVAKGSPLAGAAQPVALLAVDGRGGETFELYRLICRLGGDRPISVTLRYADGQVGQASVSLANVRWYGRWVLAAARFLPQRRDPASRLRTLAVVMGVLVLISIAGGLCRFAHEYLIGLVSERAMLDMRIRAYSNVLQLPMGWFSQQPAGDTMSRFARDSMVVQLGIRTLLGKTMREPLKAAGVFTLTLVLDWHLVVAVVVATPIAAVLIFKLGRRMRRAQRKALTAWGQLVDLLEEKVSGIGIVKAYHMERRERRRFFRQHRRLLRQQLKIVRTDAATSPLLEALGTAAVAGFVLYGGYLVFFGRVDRALFFASVFCLVAMFDPIRKLANVNNRLQAADAAAQRMFEVMDMEPEEPASAARTRVSLPRLSRSIELRGVWFAYPGDPDRAVLQDVSLQVPAGQVTAIVGPNGAGKTTLCYLLMRFYEPQRGRILLDGVDISQASLASLRGQIGLVTQETVIFTDTVRNNIAYGSSGASEAEVVAAAKAAYADEFIAELRSEQDGEVRVGYDAIISGRTLSGGQRQRIAIARAVLRDPRILIFDEATSQVDSDSEMKIQRALQEIMRGRTTILIAHRFSTIAQADRIVVMDAGKIVAVGRHETLVHSCALYRTLYERQFRDVG